MMWSKNRGHREDAVVPLRRIRFFEIDLNWLTIAPNVSGFKFEIVETPRRGVSTVAIHSEGRLKALLTMVIYFRISIASNCSKDFLTTSKPPCQKAPSRMSIPALVRISSGEADPPADKISM